MDIFAASWASRIEARGKCVEKFLVFGMRLASVRVIYSVPLHCTPPSRWKEHSPYLAGAAAVNAAAQLKRLR